ncbi:hypothetical protein AALA94_08370 [Lactococcus taiwanensis]|uniref:hypothetical protein n=1 Tax=Lactococcus taiwanensis TaxID=1151742 RepID=UPI003512A864
MESLIFIYWFCAELKFWPKFVTFPFFEQLIETFNFLLDFSFWIFCSLLILLNMSVINTNDLFENLKIIINWDNHGSIFFFIIPLLMNFSTIPYRIIGLFANIPDKFINRE